MDTDPERTTPAQASNASQRNRSAARNAHSVKSAGPRVRRNPAVPGFFVLGRVWFSRSLNKPGRERRRQGKRKYQRRKQRYDHRQCEGAKKDPDDSGKKRQRNEHNDRRQGRCRAADEQFRRWPPECPPASGRPEAIFTHIASTTTIASSITNPIDAAMPPSVIMLKLTPASFMVTSVINTVIGIVMIAVQTLPQSLQEEIKESTPTESPRI